MSGGWAQIPEAIIECLLQQVVLADYIRFSAVCASWSSVARKRRVSPRMQLPWAMVNGDCELGILEFFSPSEDRFYKLKAPEHSYCWGASGGWLMIELQSESKKGKNILLNPMTGEKIRIPPFSKLPFTVKNPRSSIHMSVLSTVPVVLDRVVVACLYDEGKLAVCIPEDRKWYAGGSKEHHYVAIVFHNECLYALDKQVQLWVAPHTTDPQQFSFVNKDIGPPLIFTSRPNRSRSTLYLTVKGGKLLMVAKTWTEQEVYYRLIRREASFFRVFEVHADNFRWEPVKGIDEYMLVLGSGYTKLFSANNTSGAIANTIYFSEDIFKVVDIAGVSRHIREHHSLLFKYSFERSCISPYFKERRYFDPCAWFSPDAWNKLGMSRITIKLDEGHVHRAIHRQLYRLGI